MATIKTGGKVLILLKRFNVNKLYRKIEGILPNGIRSRIRGVINKHLFMPNVNEETIKPMYTKAWNFLSGKIGTENLGDYLEFGVSHGTSLSALHKVLKKLGLNNVRTFGFDSFEGMPETTADEEGSYWTPGQFRSTIEETKQNLTLNGVDLKRTFLIKGWFSDTLTSELIEKHHIQKASVILIDCDIYSSSKEALDFCGPLIKGEAIVFFDDWIEGKKVCESLALDNFLKENPSFNAEEFGAYEPHGKVFLVTRS